MKNIKKFNSYLDESLITTSKELNTDLCLIFKELHPNIKGFSIWTILSPKYSIIVSELPNQKKYELTNRIFSAPGCTKSGALSFIINKSIGRLYGYGEMPPRNAIYKPWLTVNPPRFVMLSGFSIHFKKWLKSMDFALGDPNYGDYSETKHYGYYKFFPAEIVTGPLNDLKWKTEDIEKIMIDSLRGFGFTDLKIAKNLIDGIEESNISDYCDIPPDLLIRASKLLNTKQQEILEPYISGKEFNLF